MNSEWFLFKGTHHIGPFTSQEIEVMFKRGDILKTVLVWREGEASWEPLFKMTDFQFLLTSESIESNPESDIIPSVPTSTKIVVNKVKKLPEPLKSNLREIPKDKTVTNFKLQIIEDDLPPPLPLDVFEQKLNPSNSTGLDFSRKFTGVEGKDYSRFSLIGIMIACIAVFIWYFVFQAQDSVHFKIRDLMPQYVEKLEVNAAKVSLTPTISMALSMDGRTLYMSSNSSKELDIAAKLRTVKNRVLGKSEGELLLRGKVIDHLGSFDKMYFTNGQEFAPGDYDYEIHVTEKHFLNMYFPAFSKFPFAKKLNKKYTLKGTDLIYASSPREFASKIKIYKDGELGLIVRPIKENIERLATISSLLTQMTNQYIELAPKMKTGSDTKLFVNFHQQKIAPLLQSLIVDPATADGKYNEYIKDVSGLALTIITKSSTFKKIKPKDREILIMHINKDVELINMKIEQETKILEEKLKNIKSP